MAEAKVDGVTPGEWTMDFDAAKTLAGEKKLPLILNFSGSDWCGWCKIMEKNVFAEQEWKDYASDNIVMVLIDFPKDKSLVPEKYVERNDELKEAHGVRGFPTFVVLDDDAETVLGRLSAGRDKTPAAFIAELQPLLRYRTGAIEKYAKTLSEADRKKYLAITKGMSDNKMLIKKAKERIAAAEKEIETLEEGTAGLEAAAAEFRAAQLGEDKLKEYQALKAKLEKAEKALQAWLATSPERSEENQQKFQSFNAEISETAGNLAKF